MSEDSNFNHKSVLLREAVDGLCVKGNGIYVDCTAGGGGHSAEIASRLGSSGTLISVDRDVDALRACMARSKDFAHTNWMPVKCDYGDIDNMLDSMKIRKVDGILADLGVYSYQLDTAERGF